MDETCFLTAASRAGIAAAPAHALYADLYGVTRVAAPAPRLADEDRPFAEQPALTRSVQGLLYAGALLVIGSYCWWAVEATRADHFVTMLAISLGYQAAFLVAAGAARQYRLRSMAAVFGGIAVLATPLATLAVLRLAGMDMRVSYDGVTSWLTQGLAPLELATLAACGVVLWWLRHPLLMLPLMAAGCAAVLDVGVHALGASDVHRLAVPLAVCGVASVATGIALDHARLRRFALWPHVFALVSFVCLALESQHHSEIALLTAAGVSMLLGVWLARGAYLIGGGLVALVTVAVHHPSPPNLVFMGLALIAGAVWLAIEDSPPRRFLAARRAPGLS